ncbi:UNVERIFIED_CONTAM: hypothetical protein Sradi_4391700 [Sesamum radiatum]|uniref:DUF4283 domain-containing protein n=1 Tax=Sesamum radiatum TaxID=300843 RepID=A0AAW2NPA7_SESRA
MALRKHKHTQVPVWIKLWHLPVEFWTNEGLITVASGIGRPLYLDAITQACTRLDFARVCIMLDISSKLPTHKVPKEEGVEVPCRVDLEYEWLPPNATRIIAWDRGRRTVQAINNPLKPLCMFVCSVSSRCIPNRQKLIAND